MKSSPFLPREGTVGSWEVLFVLLFVLLFYGVFVRLGGLFVVEWRLNLSIRIQISDTCSSVPRLFFLKSCFSFLFFLENLLTICIKKSCFHLRYNVSVRSKQANYNTCYTKLQQSHSAQGKY